LEARTTSKRLLEDNKTLREDLVNREQKSQQNYDRLKKDYDRLKADFDKATLEANQEVCLVVGGETKIFRDFVGFVNEHLLVESSELPRLIAGLSDRLEKSERTAPKQVQKTKEALFQIPINPNYEALLMEVVSQTPTPGAAALPNSSSFSGPPPSSPHYRNANQYQVAPTSNNPAPEPKKSTSFFQKIIDAILEEHPQLEQHQVYNIITDIKNANNKTLKGLTMNDILERVNYYVNKDATEGTECSICLTGIPIGILKKLECGHEFHKKCIDDWFSHKRECPNCRRYNVNKEEFPSLNMRPRAK